MPQIFGLNLSDKKNNKFGTRANKKLKSGDSLAMRAKERTDREKKAKQKNGSKFFKSKA
jgi:hypothetical protein